LLLLPVQAKPVRQAPVPQTSAFIRGNISNSTFTRVDSSADTFIEGDMDNVHMFDVIFRGRKIARKNRK
jgi:hypothetical protein